MSCGEESRAVHPDPDVELRKWALEFVLECLAERISPESGSMIEEAVAVFCYVKDGTAPAGE
jgi:hypothetical protein